MVRPFRSSRWSSVLTLPLALWSAVPGVQWCPLGWAEVRPECFATCASPAQVVVAGSDGCCERACDAVPERRATPCPDEAACATDGEADYPGGRAYCLAGPSGGDGLPLASPVAPDAAGPAAVLPIADALAVAPVRAERPVDAPASHPPASPIGAVPRSRAPPPAGRTTC